MLFLGRGTFEKFFGRCNSHGCLVVCSFSHENEVYTDQIHSIKYLSKVPALGMINGH